jgi:hypothetical protein
MCVGTGGATGGVAHAANTASGTATVNRRRRDAMEWIFLEAGVALLLAVFIVWFTTGGKRKRPPAKTEPAADANDGANRRG